MGVLGVALRGEDLCRFSAHGCGGSPIVSDAAIALFVVAVIVVVIGSLRFRYGWGQASSSSWIARLTSLVGRRQGPR